MGGRVVRRSVGVVVVALLALGGCTGDDEESGDQPAGSGDPAPSAAEPVDEPAAAEVDCSETTLGEDGDYDFVVANTVEDGELGPACLGDEDPTLDDAWAILADIVPPEDLADLGVFAGFASGEDGDEVTVAFVNRLEASSRFQMSVNLDEAEADEDALTLTMVHEYAHVLTQLDDQLDLSVAEDDCTTYFNGDGCFVESSILDRWISAFWSNDQLAEVDPFDPSVADGEERCSLDDGFFGAYAASSPEEDLAEALSAYVLQVPAETEAQQARYDLLAEVPVFAEQRENAEAAGYGPLDNTFDDCGAAA